MESRPPSWGFFCRKSGASWHLVTSFVVRPSILAIVAFYLGHCVPRSVVRSDGTAPIPEAGRERLRRVRSKMDEIGKRLHRVAWELRPAAINELGLTTTLANYVSDWSGQIGIPADFHCAVTE